MDVCAFWDVFWDESSDIVLLALAILVYLLGGTFQRPLLAINLQNKRDYIYPIDSCEHNFSVEDSAQMACKGAEGSNAFFNQYMYENFAVIVECIL